MGMAEHVVPVATDQKAALLFQREWETYRKIIDHNYLHHNEAYAALRGLVAEIAGPLTFLDLACGDASSTVEALSGSQLSRYVGIDLSELALANAATNMHRLAAPSTLLLGDMAGALTRWTEPADLIWIGLSLHHFRTNEKRAIMHDARRIVGAWGRLAIYENVMVDGETRSQWMDRWDRQRPDWRMMSDEEWNAVTSHVHESDYPETFEVWSELGRSAGFGRVRELYQSPTRLFGVLEFGPEVPELQLGAPSATTASEVRSRREGQAATSR